jgi:ubiquinone/menaquinone biosynthesis C-methylase UbiE
MLKTHRHEKEKVKEYFKETANKWDKIRKDYYDEELRGVIIQEANIKAGNVVLDIGCGTGFLLLGAAKSLGKDGKVIGVDISEEMLKKAKENLSKAGVSNIEFKVGDAENIPLEDNSVDTVVGNMVLHHCPNPESAIKEMARVLKSKGKLVLADMEEHKEKWLKDEMADLWLGFNLGKVKQMLQKAGLRRVKLELLHTKCCGISISGRKAEIGIFIAEGEKPLQSE